VIDLHNHLLPGIDDGAPDLETSLALARIAVDDGITHMVCTPHIHPGRYENTPRIIADALAAFREGLSQAGVPLRTACASEVRIGPELLAPDVGERVPFLGEWDGRPVLLLELPHEAVPVGSDKLTRYLLDRGILPLIAHPERNKGLMQQPSRLRPFLQQGCLLQVTAGSLNGRFGERAQALAEELLANGQITILATDAHNLRYRPPLLREGYEAAAAIVGDAAAEQLVLENPWRLSARLFDATPA
jgi:protein-tyrosine phosphatase